MKLKNWCIVSKGGSPYTAPELKTPHLSGDIERDDRNKFVSGTTVTTSRIVGKKGNKVITKSGSEYELENPAPAYEEQFPNCKEKLFNSLKELS